MNSMPRPLYELCATDIALIDPRQTPHQQFWYVDIASVDNSFKRITAAQRVKGAAASVRARQVIRKDDILVSTTRPNLNGVARVPEEFDGEICSTGFCILRCGSELDPNYLFAFVQSREFIKALSELVQGALYPAVTERQVFAQTIPWVSLEKQKQIARALQAQLDTISDSLAATALQFEELRKLSASLIYQSLSQSKTTLRPLGESLCEVKSGIGSDWQRFPVLGATRSGLAPAKERPGKNPERYKPVLPGTVFYNPMRIMIGSIAFVDDSDQPGITSPDYVALKGKPGMVNSRWFYYWLRSPLGEKCINSLARGAVRERMLFNRLAEGEIDLPDFPAQEKTSAALAQIKPMRAAIEKQKQELELVKQKLLGQAFES
jgi:type I restriction enzyme S subunit